MTKKSALSARGKQRRANSSSTKKPRRKRVDDLRPEYDFASLNGGVRGKYVERLRASSNVVLLDPEVAKAFPNETAVNDALRRLLRNGSNARR